MRRVLILVLAAALAGCSTDTDPAGGEQEPSEQPAAAAEPTAQPVRRTVFAAPFENETGQDQYDPAGAAMGDLVAVLLAKQPKVRVVERGQLMAIAEEQALSLRGLTGREYAVGAGKLLEADTVLTGRLYLLEDKLTVAVTVLDIETERVVAADTISCRPTYLVEASLQLARRLGERMALPLPEIDPEDVDASPIVSAHFAKGLSRYYTGNMDEAVMLFMRTTDLDPDYIEAHYWSAMAYHRLGEPDHAAIEWERYLLRAGDSPQADKARKLLDQARDAERESPSSGSCRPRPDLGPTTEGPNRPQEQT